ncbi:MAG: corrinoid protein [Calditrichia bacterium]
MNEIFEKIATCIERGKVNETSPYPPDMKGQPGAVELTKQALDNGAKPQQILTHGFMIGMRRIGDKFGNGQAFIPDLMIAAKAMTASSELLKPYFSSGEIQHKGSFIIGTVAGDLHDIGKNIVKMILEGAGWKVIDLGTDVTTEKYLQAIAQNPKAPVGMSALLTTTMLNMEKSVKEIKSKHPDVRIIIGGAPVTDDYRKKIGADAYFQSPHGLPAYLENLL